ncbi:TetR/AcrR family transcriptional regulator [Pararhizobium sp. PWRC1-1]|uniref:TetR/AcrR family transcriptional regulator n=1 Tax=Pararhizobium sp. PWRC1-1 TaxID=2804566 RepID=UPI003CF9354C
MAKPEVRKLPKPERRTQLLDTARDILRECGADALTLGHLAERAGVSKPIAYEHFGTREGLLIALSEEIEARHVGKLKAGLEKAPPTLPAIADVISSAYIGCALESGPEWLAMSGALRGNAQMDAVQQTLADDYVAIIAAALARFSTLPPDDLRLRCVGLAGAAETMARELIRGRIGENTASANLAALIMHGIAA